MKKDAKISNAVIRRLPRYRRYLRELQKKGISKISSGEFSHLIGYTASQIRQDLNSFGGFGQQGYGYNVDGLYNEISAILGLDKTYKMVVVGAGNLGQAIANHTSYYKAGFHICAVFEINPKLIGTTINNTPVLDVDNIVEYVEENKIDIGVICTTREDAQAIADQLCFAGVRGIWNFAPVDIEVPEHVALENVHISETLHSLAYHMNMQTMKEQEAKNKEVKNKEAKSKEVKAKEAKK